MLHMKKSTIQKINEKYQKTGSVINKPRKGRPKKTCERSDRLIVSKSNRRKSPTQITDDMVYSIHIRNCLEIVYTNKAFMAESPKRSDTFITEIV